MAESARRAGFRTIVARFSCAFGVALACVAGCAPMQVFPALESIGGPPWTLAAWQANEAVAEGIDITLSHIDGALVGRSGCNRYRMPVADGYEPGRLRPGAVAVTRMACADEILRAEARFLERLARIDRFELHAGELRLIEGSAGTSSALLLTRR